VATIIKEKLKEIEQRENCRILLAVESGSREWGFASPDSDYDVRFIYVRSKEAYLRLDRMRDVIEVPINDTLDINGWDIDKTLRLLHKSNPTVFEWLSSPIVYRSSDFAEHLSSVMQNWFSAKSSLWHYIHMAETNYRGYLREDMVKAKKYFYVLRPILACRWILEKKTPPPMLFSTLMEQYLDESLKSTVGSLLDLKINAPEVKLIPRVDVINTYLEQSMEEIHDDICKLPKESYQEWDGLNKLFLDAVGM